MNSQPKTDMTANSDLSIKPIDHLVHCGRADDTALVLRDREYKYKQLTDRVARLAGWLRSQVNHDNIGEKNWLNGGSTYTDGVPVEVRAPQVGPRIASWAAKGELTCLLPLAAARAGMVHVPINPLLKKAQAAHILADCGASLLLGTKARLDSLEEGDVPNGCATLDEKSVIAVLDRLENSDTPEAQETPEALESSETSVVSEASEDLDDTDKSGHPDSGDKAQAIEPLPPSDADPDALCAILYTSGSTGKPKGVMLSHANIWLGAASVARYLKMERDDVTLAVLPFAFDYGQNQLLSTWFAGGSVIPLDYLFAKDVARACSKYGVTTLAAVPPLWVQLTEIEWFEEAAAPLRRLTNSGGALTVELVKALTEIFPQADIYPMYGLTEAFRSTFLDPKLVSSNPTSMGKAIPFAEILVINDAGNIADDDEEGELVHCGPLVAQGYWQDAERTKERFKPAPASSQFGGMAVWSGDRVRRDAQGLLYFVGRRDAMIKSAGNRISPQEVEDAAMATLIVSQAVALGVPDARLGQTVHLVVSAAHSGEDVGGEDVGGDAGTGESAGASVRGDTGASANGDTGANVNGDAGAGEKGGGREALPKMLAAALPNFMQPHQIHWWAEMPLNPNGKLDRNAIAQKIMQNQQEVSQGVNSQGGDSQGGDSQGGNSQAGESAGEGSGQNLGQNTQGKQNSTERTQ